MRVAHPLLLVLAFVSTASAQTPAPALDFEFFKTRVQPIFLAERPGHAHSRAGEPVRSPGQLVQG